MPFGSFPTEWQRLWSAWNIRGCMIFAVAMQLLLTVFASFRRTTSKRFWLITVWGAYLLVDWTAVFAYGLITNSIYRSCPGQPSQVAGDYLALWAAYLLVHLGGPDTITAFSMEDNALWLRQLAGLVAQLSAFFYIIGKTLSRENSLTGPTLLVFVAGVMTYEERPRSLYLASLERMRRSGEKSLLLLDPSRIHPSWRYAYQLSQTLKGLVVDIIPSSSNLRETREFFLKEDAEIAFEVLTKEMSLLYDMLYTKTLALRSGWGVLSRSISFISLGIVSLWLNFLKKNEQHKIDYRITTLLGYEAFFLQTATTCMFFRPDWRLRKRIPTALWSESMGTFDLVACCFKETTQTEGRWCCYTLGSLAEKIGAGEIVVEMKYVSKIPFDTRLWKFVFDELKVSLGIDNELPTIDGGRAREIYEARGNLAVRRARCNDLTHFIEDYEFDSSLLMWHIATVICYHLDEASSEEESDNRKYSKVISNYMVYLMVKQPKLMSPVLGIGYDRYRETCEEMKCRGGSINTTDMKEFCIKLLSLMEDIGEERDDSNRSKSVLINSCNLTRILLNKEMKWKIISEVWVEMLVFAAGHCRAESYARLLAEGGEFISFIWLLMSQLGIGPRVPVE